MPIAAGLSGHSGGFSGHMSYKPSVHRESPTVDGDGDGDVYSECWWRLSKRPIKPLLSSNTVINTLALSHMGETEMFFPSAGHCFCLMAVKGTKRITRT